MKKRALDRIILICSLLFSFLQVFAQPKWVNYTTDDVYPHVHLVEDTVWYTFRGGVATIVINTNETTLYHTANTDLPSNYIRYSTLAPDGTLWVLSNQKIGQFVDGNYLPFENLFEGDKELFYMGEMHFDQLGNLVIGARYVENGDVIYGLFRIAPDGNISLAVDEEIAGHPVSYNFAIDNDNRIWIGNQGNEVKVVDFTGELSLVNPDNSVLLDENVTKIINSPTGKICALQASSSGSIPYIQLSVFNGQEWVTATADYNNTALSVIGNAFYDQDENLWISLSDGKIIKYTNGDLQSFPWPLDISVQGGGSKALMNVDEEGRWWLFNYNFHKNRLHQYHEGNTTSYSLVSGDFSSNIMDDVFIDRAGKVWAISNSGVYEFDGLDWTSHIDEMYIPRFYMNNIQMDTQGNIWVSAKHDSGEMCAFAKYDGETWEYFHLGTIGSTFVRAIHATEFFFDPNGILWAASNAGLLEYDGLDWEFHEPPNWNESKPLKNLVPKSNGTFYVAGYRELYEYNGTGFEEIYVPLESSGSINWLFLDQSENLWISHSGNLGIYDGANYIDVTDMMPEGVIGSLFDMTQDLSGIYWFATCDGLLRYDQDTWEYYTEGVTENCITNVEVDSFNNVWMIALLEGLAVYNENGINKLAPPLGACVQGETYYDINGNGIQDMGDYTLGNQKVRLLPDSTVKFTSIVGEYQFQTADYSEKKVEILPNEDDWTLSSDSASYNVSIEESCVDSLNFGLSTTETNTNAVIDLTASSSRCNETTPIWLRVQNRGYLPFSGIYHLTLDEGVTFATSIPLPVDSAGSTYFWDIDHLQPFGIDYIKVGLQYPGVEALGDTVFFDATLFDNEGVLKDSASIAQEVFCSYDPNDKSAQPTGPSLGELSLIEDALEYLVRFENTGNDTAFQVVIRDQLSPWLDPGSLELISSSHPVDVTIRGQMVEFFFNPIQLPYTDIDPIGSQGFVKFRISPLSTVQDNQLIENTAHIYFDFNPPIVTNTVRNILVEELPVINSTQAVINNSQCQSLITPNPVSDLAWVQVDEAFWHGQFILYNSIGVKVLEMKNVSKTFSFQRNDLPSGIYFYHFRKDDEICSGKLLVN